jgi:hypothetical protein
MIDYQSAPNGRAWCFVFQYPNKKKAMFGTVYVRNDAPHQEIEAACIECWAEVFPFDCPPIVKLLPGQAVFLPEEVTT